MSAESDHSSLYPQECLQMFPKKQQNLMMSQVQALKKQSECAPVQSQQQFLLSKKSLHL